MGAYPNNSYPKLAPGAGVKIATCKQNLISKFIIISCLRFTLVKATDDDTTPANEVDDYTQEGTKFYKAYPSTEGATRDEAQAQCIADGAQLATFNTYTELIDIYLLIHLEKAAHTVEFFTWTGVENVGLVNNCDDPDDLSGRDPNCAGMKWIDGSDVANPRPDWFPTVWADSSDECMALEFQYANDKVNDLEDKPCSNIYGYICEKGSIAQAPTANYEAYGSKFYRIYSNPEKFEDANETCTADGAILATFKKEEEYLNVKRINEKLFDLFGHDGVWSGVFNVLLTNKCDDTSKTDRYHTNLSYKYVYCINML